MYDDDTFEHNGNRYRVAFPRDEIHGAPWEEEDGHGPVTEARRRANYHGYIRKAPGHRFLGEHWLYDFAEACRIARRDGWGHMPYWLTITHDASGYTAEAGPFRASHPDDINAAVREVYDLHRRTFPSARAYAAAAAEADFQRLQDWCNDRWCYVGCVVTLLDEDGDETDETASLWGIESDAGDFLEEVARELADEIATNLKHAASVG